MSKTPSLKTAGDAADKTGALARGLSVLVAVNDLDSGTLSALVSATGLAKPTVLRLLATLEAEGYIRKDVETNTYAAAPKVRSLARAFVGKSREKVEVQEILDELAPVLKWPVEFLVPDGSSMVIEANNRELAPIKLRLFERRRFPLLQSGAGIAYAASRSPEELAALLHASGLSEDEQGEVTDRIKQSILKGYAMHQYRDLAPNLTVLSVLVPGAIGALSVPHFNDVLSEERAVEIVLPKLQAAASSIVEVFLR